MTIERNRLTEYEELSARPTYDALTARVAELESNLALATAIVEREGNRNDALNAAKARVAELEAALRDLCNISDEGYMPARAEWAWDRARAALAKGKA